MKKSFIIGVMALTVANTKAGVILPNISNSKKVLNSTPLAQVWEKSSFFGISADKRNMSDKYSEKSDMKYGIYNTYSNKYFSLQTALFGGKSDHYNQVEDNIMSIGIPLNDKFGISIQTYGDKALGFVYRPYHKIYLGSLYKQDTNSYNRYVFALGYQSYDKLVSTEGSGLELSIDIGSSKNSNKFKHIYALSSVYKLNSSEVNTSINLINSTSKKDILISTSVDFQVTNSLYVAPIVSYLKSKSSFYNGDVKKNLTLGADIGYRNTSFDLTTGYKRVSSEQTGYRGKEIENRLLFNAAMFY